MKRKTPKFIRLFMVLALVAGIMGALVPVGTARGALSTGATVLGTGRAGEVDSYTITFTVGAVTDIPVQGNILFTFPAGTTVPSSVPPNSVTINGISSTSAPVVATSARTIRVFWGGPSNVAIALATVIFTAESGIVNPITASADTSATYDVTIDPSGAAAITNPVHVISRWAVNTTRAQANASFSLSGGGLTPGTTATASGPAVGSGSVDATGHFSFSAIRLASGGDVGVVVTDTGSPVRTVTSNTLTLVPSLTASPSTVKPQDLVTLRLSNFTPSGNTTAIVVGGTTISGGNEVTPLPFTLTSSGSSGATGISIRIPSAQPVGTTQIRVTDDGTDTQTVTVEVVARIVVLGPTSGISGTTRVTAIGSGFPASLSNGTITIGGLGAGVTGMVSIATDTAGNFTTTFTLPPGLTGGSNTVVTTFTAPVAPAGDGGTTTLFGAFTVTVTSRVLSVSQGTGPRGTRFVVSGSGLTPNVNIAIGGLTLGGLSINTVAIGLDSTGAFAGFTAVVPSGAAYESNSIRATDGTLSGFTTFTVTRPNLSHSPVSGPVGLTVNITGSGWLANSLVTVRRNAVAALTVTADGSGNITAQLPIPSTLFTGTILASPVSIDAVDSSLNTVIALTYSILPPVLTVGPTTVEVGGTASVTGTGFLPFTGLTLLTIGGASVLPTAAVITDSTGSFSTSFLVPGLIGVQTVSATVGLTNRNASLTITAATGGTNQPIVTETALQVLISAGVLELAAGVAGGGSVFQAFVPGLPGNQLVLILPNSVLILTLTRTTTVVVSGVAFTVQGGVPSFLPVGNNVTITIA